MITPKRNDYVLVVPTDKIRAKCLPDLINPSFGVVRYVLNVNDGSDEVYVYMLDWDDGDYEGPHDFKVPIENIQVICRGFERIIQ